MTSKLAYADTCLLVPIYINEPGSPIAQRTILELTDHGEFPLLVSEAGRLEFFSVIARHARIGTIDKDEAQRIVIDFEHHCERDYTVIPVQTIDFIIAQQWLRLLTVPLKAMDSLHLAIAHANNATLLTADKQLAAAAANLEIEHYFVPFL